MAEKILNTRIALKIDTLENWKTSSLVLKKGEVAIATVAAEAGTNLTEPVCMIKIGDGEKTFSQLDWNFYAKAADVIAAAKSEDTLRTFINGVIADAGIATNEAMEALSNRVGTVEGLVGSKAVATQIEEAIAALKLADTYAAKVHGHEIADVNGLADAIADAKKAGTDANSALESYKSTNDTAVAGKADKVHTHTKAEITDFAHTHTVSEITDMETYIAGKDFATKAEAQGYADAKDEAIAAAKKAGDDAQAYAEGVAGDLAEAVEALEGADADQVERIEALEGTIVGLSGAMHFEGVKDAVPEGEALADYENGDVIIVGNKEYVMNNGAFVEFGDASVNAEAITELTGRVGTAEGKITTLEGEMDAVEGRAKALEDKVGSETVEAQINAAIEALKIGDYAKAADLTAAINQHNTDKAALEAEIAKKANDADLAAIAKSGNVNDLVQTEGDVLVFDCGTSA